MDSNPSELKSTLIQKIKQQQRITHNKVEREREKEREFMEMTGHRSFLPFSEQNRDTETAAMFSSLVPTIWSFMVLRVWENFTTKESTLELFE